MYMYMYMYTCICQNYVHVLRYICSCKVYVFYVSHRQYLDALFKRDAQAGQEYHARQVRLYAEFERAKLLSFLKSSNSFYSLHEALEECRQRNFIPEMVYLLGRCSDAALYLLGRFSDAALCGFDQRAIHVTCNARTCTCTCMYVCASIAF